MHYIIIDILSIALRVNFFHCHQSAPQNLNIFSFDMIFNLNLTLFFSKSVRDWKIFSCDEFEWFFWHQSNDNHSPTLREKWNAIFQFKNRIFIFSRGKKASLRCAGKIQRWFWSRRKFETRHLRIKPICVLQLPDSSRYDIIKENAKLKIKNNSIRLFDVRFYHFSWEIWEDLKIGFMLTVD